MRDPAPEIYAAMDRAGLTPGNLLTKRMSMEKLVNQIRSQLVTELKTIIERMENARTEI